jgi:hypothetical protein
LLPERLIKAKGLFQVGLDDGIETLFLIEWPPRGNPHQKERHSYNHEQRWDGCKQTLDDITQHGEQYTVAASQV